MARPIFDLVKGSNEPIIVQLYPDAADTGSNGIDLTGATSMSASAKHIDTGVTIAFSSAAVYGSATDGSDCISVWTFVDHCCASASQQLRICNVRQRCCWRSKVRSIKGSAFQHAQIRDTTIYGISKTE